MERVSKLDQSDRTRCVRATVGAARHTAMTSDQVTQHHMHERSSSAGGGAGVDGRAEGRAHVGGVCACGRLPHGRQAGERRSHEKWRCGPWHRTCCPARTATRTPNRASRSSAAGGRRMPAVEVAVTSGFSRFSGPGPCITCRSARHAGERAVNDGRTAGHVRRRPSDDQRAAAGTEGHRRLRWRDRRHRRQRNTGGVQGLGRQALTDQPSRRVTAEVGRPPGASTSGRRGCAVAARLRPLRFRPGRTDRVRVGPS